jgi:uncharacterized protein (DUF952 family)
VSILYKIMPKKEWEQAQSEGAYTGSAVDRGDGFIHLSAAHQVRETAAKHFAQQENLVLLSIDEDSIGDSLKWEISRGGALFPHVYGPLPINAVREANSLPLENGEHQFPESLIP